MNDLVKIAQNTATPLAKKIVKLTRPADGTPVVITVDSNTILDLTAISNENIVLVHAGDRLIVMFSDRSSIVLSGFYGPDNQPILGLEIELGQSNPIPALRLAGLLPISEDQSILPASGAASSAGITSSSLSSETAPSSESAFTGGTETSGNGTFGADYAGIASRTLANDSNTQANGADGRTTLGGVLSGAVVEDVTGTASAKLTINAPGTQKFFFAVQSITNGTYGTFSLSADGVWTYRLDNTRLVVQNLAIGQVVSETFTAVAGDGTISEDITLTITGTNDAPVIAAIAQSGLTEKTDTSALTTTIAVSFSDVDLTDTGHSATITGIAKSGITSGLALTDTQLKALVTPGTVTKTSGSSAGSVDLAFSSASTDFDYLSLGEILTLTYTLTINDGDGGITTRDFVVTVTGTNDAPVIAAMAQSDLTEKTDTSALTTTIAVSFSDVDLTDTGHSATITGIAKSGITTGLALTDTQLKALVTPGTVTKTSGSSAGSVNLAFSSASTDFDYLSVGEVLTLTYTLTVNDGDGGITTRDFVVTVTGTNDAPVIAAIAQSGLTEKTDTSALTTTIAVSFSDVDLTDTGHSATITGIAKSGITSGLALTDTQLKALVTPGTVTKTSGSSAGSVDLAFSSASTDFDYLSSARSSPSPTRSPSMMAMAASPPGILLSPSPAPMTHRSLPPWPRAILPRRPTHQR